MNSYRRGSSTIVASSFGLAPGGAQLKVENPVALRTICNFAFREHLIAAGQQLFYPEPLIKNQNRDSSTGGDTNIARKKSAQPGGKGFIDESGGGGCGYESRTRRRPARLRLAPHYGSINRPLAALIAASVRVAAPSLPRALSV
jgi:hypothetical protein